MTEHQPWAPPPAPTVTSPTPGASWPVRVVSWLGWHVIELAGVGVPGVLAVTSNGWWAVLAVGAGAGWVSHELRLARARRAVQAALPSAEDTHSRADRRQLGGHNSDNDDEGRKEVNGRGMA
ncbi:hypothetical protein [Actinocrispum sp. NPDC049592]|uniref:hypothetical protein n=1 Tax=Actinocrispum sp. NPDC049592 TaxID=3154835 RepID=UPI0034360AF4